MNPIPQAIAARLPLAAQGSLELKPRNTLPALHDGNLVWSSDFQLDTVLYGN